MWMASNIFYGKYLRSVMLLTKNYIKKNISVNLNKAEIKLNINKI